MAAVARSQTGSENTKTTTDTGNSTTSKNVSSESRSSEADLSNVSALAQEDPTQVIKDAVSAAEDTLAFISTTEGFTAAAVANPDLIRDFASRLPDNLGDGFMTALSKNNQIIAGFGFGSLSFVWPK